MCQVWLKLAVWFYREEDLSMYSFILLVLVTFFGKGHGPSFEQTWILFSKSCYNVASLVELRRFSMFCYNLLLIGKKNCMAIKLKFGWNWFSECSDLIEQNEKVMIATKDNMQILWFRWAKLQAACIALDPSFTDMYPSINISDR